MKSTHADESSPVWALGDYAVVFALANGQARTVNVSDEGIVNVWYGCGDDATVHAGRGDTFILELPAQ